MSYILEALRKSEQERSLGRVPHPGREPPAPPPRRSVGTRLWPWLAGVGLTVNLGLLAWIALRPEPVSDRSVAEAVPPAPPVPSPAVSSVSVPQVPAQPVQPVPIVERETPPPASRAEGAAPPAVSKTSAGPQPMIPQPAGGAVPGGEVPVPRPPLWEEMPEAFRQRVVRPELEVHFYTERPARRFVFIGLKKYREGERLANGLVLEAITPEGAVLSSGGHRFRVERP